MTTIGTPLSASATKVLFCGAGELGKEVALELQRYGVEVIALDRYANAPAMQVAHRSHIVDMLDGKALRAIIEKEKPDFVVPEIEAIATQTLLALEQEGVTIVPSARAVNLTMNREGIRCLAAEELGLLTSPYLFADSFETFEAAISKIGMPCLVKPIMSSSGKGQSLVKDAESIRAAWDYAQTGGRAGQGKVIVEGFVDFDYEITLLTVRHGGKTSYCAPIGHVQKNGDYQQSWQPQAMSDAALKKSQDYAHTITKSLGGNGLFGVEFFIKGDDVYFSEVSPRPHDTGLVTLISQDISEFALHARAILGLPIPGIRQMGNAASSVILVEGESSNIEYSGIENALKAVDTQLRLFGKPEVSGTRRMGVGLALGESVDEAITKAKQVSSAVSVKFLD
jgi:phosphoribosylglycinamide formyltransferase 2